MTDERYSLLMANDSQELTPEEIAVGWHFCGSEWDGLLIGPGMREAEFCSCGDSEAPSVPSGLKSDTAPRVSSQKSVSVVEQKTSGEKGGAR